MFIVCLKTQAKIAKTTRNLPDENPKKEQNLLCMHNKFRIFIFIFEQINLKYI
tara:strand:+ start:1012 stop:1170 length:159 start_codon:yes stop_codon:yes gene_type:complete